MSTQVPLNLPHRVALERGDFLVTLTNTMAAAMIDRWPDWSSRVAVVVGPPGSGKTHLAEVWRRTSGAACLAADTLAAASLPDLITAGAVVVEAADTDAAAATDNQTALFHLLNLAGQEDVWVLVTMRTAPGHWPPQPPRLPDLISRLLAAPTAFLEPPDDILLRAVILKLFADRQIPVSPKVIAWIATRIDRSLAAASEAVALLDRASLSGKSPITVPFCAKVIGQ